MPEDAQITFISTTLPEGTCYANDQARFNGFAAALQGFLPGNFTAWNVGSTTPSPENQDKPWLKLTIDGFIDRIYYFSNGAWVAPNLEPANGSVRRIWVGSLVSLKSYDGGEDAAVTATTGPMWEEDTAFQARTIVGVGTLPLSSTAVTVGGTGGVDQVTLTVAQIPPHTHTYRRSGDNGETINEPEDGAPGAYANAQTGSTGGGDPHTNMPPYVGVYVIKRTNRIYYRA